MAEPLVGRTREAQRRLLDVTAHARAVAEDLFGLSVEEARSFAARDGLVVLGEISSRGRPVIADFRGDRIIVLVENGIVVEARGGC